MGSVGEWCNIPTSFEHVQKTVVVPLFFAQQSQACLKFKVATGTLGVVSAHLLHALCPANGLRQRAAPVCPCIRAERTRSSPLDIAPAKADRMAQGAHTPTMRLHKCHNRGWKSSGCLWRPSQQGHPKIYFYRHTDIICTSANSKCPSEPSLLLPTI